MQLHRLKTLLVSNVSPLYIRLLYALQRQLLSQALLRWGFEVFGGQRLRVWNVSGLTAQG